MDLDIETYLRPNLPKMVDSHKWKSSNYKTSTRKHGKIICDIEAWKDSLNCIQKAKP